LPVVAGTGAGGQENLDLTRGGPPPRRSARAGRWVSVTGPVSGAPRWIYLVVVSPFTRALVDRYLVDRATDLRRRCRGGL